MASPMVLADKIEVVLWSQFTDQAGLNVLHYNVIGLAGSGADVEDVPGAMFSHFSVHYAGLMSNQAKFLGVIARRLNVLTAVGPFFSNNPAADGSYAGDALPRQTCGLITKRTSQPGPRNRGRVYVPFPAEGANAIGAQPDAAYLVVLGGLANAVKTQVLVGGAGNTATLYPVILRRPFTGAYIDIVNAQARTRWATQRRRGSYGRPNIPPF
jgi:hypothetical protein